MDEFFRVDDLLNLDFSNDDDDDHHLFSSAKVDHHLHHHYQIQQPSDHHHHIKSHYEISNSSHLYNNSSCSSITGPGSSYEPHDHHSSYDFTGQLYVPDDDVAELEWLSNSFANDLTGHIISQSHTSSIPSAARSKRSRQRTWKASSSAAPQIDRSVKQEMINSSMSEFVDDSSSSGISCGRRCSHCASEKTPQWRTGPTGPKTLCNACGVRYKSGRLVPEYRPAASPTFVLTQHSNSHRKVMELRRQKEVTINQQQGQIYRHIHDFQLC
ncbi:unnamed protein product [Rhodiola kirilowii]